ncbi:MAG: HAD family hydrolase [Spirochaetales bacterium]|nr:HAD family hydrolase [Spirochaetales bacterium]
MKCYSLPERIQGLIFDIDQTLYRHDHYYSLQEDLQVREFAACEKIPYAQAAERIHDYREQVGRKQGGKKPSLGNTFSHFGYPVAVTAKWREKLLFPEEYLSYDEKLVQVMEKLAGQCRIAAVTNNAEKVGWKTLEVLGIKPFFVSLIGLDTSGVSKPHEAPFLAAVKELGLSPAVITALGDRYHIDLEIPLSLGMGGILVESMEDVYALDKTICAGVQKS